MNLFINNNQGGTSAGIAGASITTGNTVISQSGTLGTGKSHSKKSLKYNSKEISAQILRATKSRTAATVLTKAKNTVSNLRRCLGTGEYNDSEVEAALAHAKRMVKCAQSKVNHLCEEENLQRKYERRKASKERQQKSEIKRRVHQKEQDLEQKIAMEELEQARRQKSDKQEIVRKKRMHRNDELGKINEADMKYLQSTIDSQKSTGLTENTSAIVELSDAGIRLSELQQAQSAVEAETEMETETPDMAADAGAANAADTGGTSGIM